MTSLDTGTYGAKRQSFRKASPRDLLKRLMEENSRASEQKLQAMFADKVRSDDDYIDAIIEYWFANNYRSLVSKPEAPAQKQRAVAERAARVEVIKEKIKIAATRIVLLDITMPNGKALRDCTGKDCAKAGGWLSKIAKSIKTTDVVGKVMSESAVQKIFRSS